MKKKITAVFLAVLMSLGLVSCGTDGENPSPDSPAKVELTVFAAASMTETLTEISSLYAEKRPEVHLVFNFDSSGTLKTQIQEGAGCDLFLSAGQKQMNQLDSAASPEVNTEGLDFVMTAMFVVIFLEQWMKEKKHYTALIGVSASAVCLLLFDADSFLIPTMIFILCLLTIFRKPIEKAGGLI